MERCFTPEVLFDRSSLGAGQPARVPAREIVAGWATGLAAIEHVHHQAGNFVVRVAADGAEALGYGNAELEAPEGAGGAR